ncbi:Mesothelin-like protein [Bagarius yarrelli]|uniref:Mesothelin-like protein n=1 Tax=Bagarius yarrelli TaxID=175774 RepID=A0A556VAI2_BAGYA|nr:Mesothelin-like protein [Bagarius yarrelli]
MRERHIFPLLLSGVLSFGTFSTALHGRGSFDLLKTRLETNDSTSAFLKCVGVPTDPGAMDQQILGLKALLDALLDVFVFMDSGLKGSPLMNVSAGLSINSTALWQDDDIIRMWLQIKFTPLLSTVSQNFLTCLGYTNFSCQTYQTVFVCMLGCVHPSDTTEDWLIKNFGSFSVLAQIRDFGSINRFFNGLNVLHLLSMEQKAALMLYPESAGLNNDSLSVVLSNLMSSLSDEDVNTFNGTAWNAGFPLTYSSSPQDTLTQTVNSFMTAFSPVGSFVREFVSLTHQQDLSSMRSATLVQAMLNWTLAELAAPYKNSTNQTTNQTMFNSTDVNSWFAHVVVPVLNRFISSDIPAELTAVFHNVFYLENPVNTSQDTCNVTLNGQCANFSSEDSPFRDILERIHDPTHTDLSNEIFVSMWFHIKLKPLLPKLTPDYLLCLSAKPFSCQTFQILVKEMSNHLFLMSENTSRAVYENFIIPFLIQQNSTGACMLNSSSEWILKNLNKFSHFATVKEMYILNPKFDALEALPALTLSQIAEVIIVEDLPRLPDKEKLIDIVFSNFLTSETRRRQLPQLVLFISQMNTMDVLGSLSLAQLVQVSTSPDLVSTSAQVNQVMNKVPDSELGLFFTKLSYTLTVFDRVNLKDSMLPDSEVEQWLGIRLPPFISNIQTSQIPLFFSMIIQRSCNISQQGVALLNSTQSKPLLLNCYNNQSYYSFLKLYFMGFQFPSLSTFLSLMPPGRMSEKPPSSSSLASQTLQCVWPRAISATSQVDVDRWFNVTLVQYLPYLSSQMISSTQMSIASCFAFRKFVSVLGKNNSVNGITKQEVYTSIQSYLTTENQPKCYNPSDPMLNSTAWFYQYIGDFITFISVDDLQQFGGIKLQQFTLDKQNLELFRYNNVRQDVITVYTNMLYDANPDFNILFLPKSFWCSAPAGGFLELTQSDAVNITKSLQRQCTNIDPTVSAALMSNVATLTPDVIEALGKSITGLNVGQITDCSPSTLLSSLSFLSSVDGWSQSQALVIIGSLLTSGVFKITSVESLQQLGSLLIGVPSTWFSFISGDSLLTALQSQTFLSNVANTPITTQQIIVNQIISVNSSSDTVVQNMPESMTTLIPRPSLLFLTQHSATTLNQKQWTRDQANLIFENVAAEFPNADNISFQVLQGFTCTRVQKFSSLKVKNLIRGCRRRGNTKINLQESQVQPSQCQAYYSALGDANFSVFSSTLAFRRNILFTNARQCLGISGTSLNQTQLDVMGRMVCVFNSTYILNSHSSLLEKIKLCDTLTEEQSSAVESVLLSGNTIYGAPASWNGSTLNALGDLPLYLSSTFWAYLTQGEKMKFLRKFIPGLMSRGLSRATIFTLITKAGKESRSSTRSLLRFKRDTACTAGEITQVQASDASFPFGYDMNQFNVCLSVQTLKENLGAITGKATGSEYQKIILDKLNQAYPNGISDQVLQVLGPASRAASTTDISKWNVTMIDTLAALMRPLANALSVSHCSLEQKQLLFSIAQLSYRSLSTKPTTNTDLTVREVQGLLGVNVPDLKTYESNAVVHSWISRQLQSDLDTLGIGLTGGRAGPTTATVSPITTKPTGACSSVFTLFGLQKLLFYIAVTMATLQLFH